MNYFPNFDVEHYLNTVNYVQLLPNDICIVLIYSLVQIIHYSLMLPKAVCQNSLPQMYLLCCEISRGKKIISRF